MNLRTRMAARTRAESDTETVTGDLTTMDRQPAQNDNLSLDGLVEEPRAMTDSQMNLLRPLHSVHGNLLRPLHSGHRKSSKHGPDQFHLMEHFVKKPSAKCENLGVADLGVGFHILNIGDIETATNSFIITFWIYLVWNDPEQKGKQGWPRVKLNPKDTYIPEIVVVNAMGTVTQPSHTHVEPHMPSDPDCTLVRLQQKMSVRCHVMLEVQDFPSDMQELTLAIYFPFHFKRFPLAKPRIHPLAVNGRDAIAWHQGVHFLPDFAIRQPIIRCVTTKALRFGELTHQPEVHLTLHVQRASSYYFFNYICFVGGVSSMSVASLWIDPMDVGRRLKIDVTVVLTVSTIKFIIAKHLPRVPYFTLIDKYIFMAVFFIIVLIFLGVVTANVAGRARLGTWGTPPGMLWLDLWLGRGWFGAWVCYNLYVLWAARSNSQHLAALFPVVARPGDIVLQTEVAGGVFFDCRHAMRESQVGSMWNMDNSF